MCGIAGIYSLREGLAPPALEALDAMAGVLRHRGPDESGVYRDSRAGLAHTRLAIIDVSTGQQPLCNEDGRVWIVFNGEIFNYVELRRELVATGHRFRTHSDTEVLVHAYEKWGLRAFERLNGQWAAAVWDARIGRLILSRDRLGVRPLYTCEHAGRLYFASEVKAIFAADATVPRALDPVGLSQTFTFWSVVPPQTVFRGISELAPGHTCTYSAHGRHDVCYWRPSFPVGVAGEPRAGEFGGTLDAAVAAVRERLIEATRLRLVRSDVPVGAYVSGGLDSAIVAAIAARHSAQRLRTFSVGFEDAEFDERPHQRKVAAALRSEHSTLVVSRRDIADAFPAVIAHAERPLLRTAAAPLYLLSQAVNRSGIKVVLTGEGADEMFAGYDVFREARIRRFWARQPESRWRPLLLERLYPHLERSPVAQRAFARKFFGRHLESSADPGFGHEPRWRSTAVLMRLFDLRFLAGASGTVPDVVRDLLADLPLEFRAWTPLAQDQYLEIRTLLSGYLLSSQGDRMLMAHSIEGRFPFLDHDVIQLANALPPRYKLRGLDEKHVLKRAAEGLVPPPIVARAKQPYRAPDASAFLTPDAGTWIHDTLDARAVADAGVFSPRAVDQLWRKLGARGDGREGSNTDNMALVGVLSTQLLHQQFIARRPQPDAPCRHTTVVDRMAAQPPVRATR